MKHVLVAVAALTFVLASSAQHAGKSEVFTSRQIQSQLLSLVSQADVSGSSSVTLADYGSHKLMLSVRTKGGGAEIHAHYDDVIVVQQGIATIITGGSLVDASIEPGGESKGSSIRGGKSVVVGPGDVVTVNAGVPHQTLVPAGRTYSALVIKVREP